MDNFFNFVLLFIQVGVISSLILLALRLGKEVLSSFLLLLAICMNLFVMKQITLIGLEVTCSEGLSVGYLLGCNLMQEFYGKEASRKTLWLTFFCSATFMLLSQIHLLFKPSIYDLSQTHFVALFSFLPRIVLSSIVCFLIVGLFDLTLFAYLRKKLEGKYLVGRLFISLSLSQAIDTILFSFMALYGIVENISHLIFFCFAIKIIVLLLSTPFISLAKRIIRREQLPV